jgi:hypothetical protein
MFSSKFTGPNKSKLPIIPLSLTGSPLTYINNSNGLQNILMSGSTITNSQFSRDGITNYIADFNSVLLNIGDQVIITYTGTPAITIIQIT